jgi:DNA-binding response OmpR family regulator
MIENDRMHDDARAEFGKSLVQDIATKSNAGLIVHSSLPPERESPDILEIGADDYIWKYPRTTDDRIPEIIRARVGSLWRRIQATRPKTSHLFAHRGRVFDVGGWRFTVGDRTVVNEQGQSERLSPTEYSLLQYACVIDGHEVDAEMFAQQVLRKEIGEPFRLDNLKYRLGRRLHDALIWRADGDGNYTLINVNELKPGVGKRTH